MGCRTAAFLAETAVASLGQLDRAPRAAAVLMARAESLRDFTGRTGGREVEGGENAFFDSEDRIKKYVLRGLRRNEVRVDRRQREPAILASVRPPVLPVKNLERAKWPEAATVASAIEAAAWQPKM